MIYRRGSTRKSTVALAFVAGLIPLTAVAANLSFLRNSPLSYFTQADIDMMIKAAGAILEASDPHAEQAWDNPRSGASGLVQGKAQFTTRDGTLCKRLRVVSRARKLESETVYTVCKDPARGWILNEAAEPRT